MDPTDAKFDPTFNKLMSELEEHMKTYVFPLSYNVLAAQPLPLVRRKTICPSSSKSFLAKIAPQWPHLLPEQRCSLLPGTFYI